MLKWHQYCDIILGNFFVSENPRICSTFFESSCKPVLLAVVSESLNLPWLIKLEWKPRKNLDLDFKCLF